MIIVTTNEVPGYAIEAVLGEVMGITVRSANSGADVAAGYRSISGGEATEYTRLSYESRNEVMHRMWTDAQRRGANAIVGMRFDTGDITQSFSEICAYGTAVVVRPLREDEPGATPQSIQQAGPGRAPEQQSAPASAQPSQQPAPGPHGYSPQVPPPAAGPDPNQPGS